MGLGNVRYSRLQRTQADELGLSYRSEPLPPPSLLFRMAKTAELPWDLIFGADLFRLSLSETQVRS